MLDGALVLLDPDSGKFFSLGDTGLAVWQLLDEHDDVDHIVEALSHEYAVDADTCRADVLRFADRLAAAGFAELR